MLYHGICWPGSIGLTTLMLTIILYCIVRCSTRARHVGLVSVFHILSRQVVTVGMRIRGDDPEPLRGSSGKAPAPCGPSGWLGPRRGIVRPQALILRKEKSRRLLVCVPLLLRSSVDDFFPPRTFSSRLPRSRIPRSARVRKRSVEIGRSLGVHLVSADWEIVDVNLSE